MMTYHEAKRAMLLGVQVAIIRNGKIVANGQIDKIVDYGHVLIALIGRNSCYLDELEEF